MPQTTRGPIAFLPYRSLARPVWLRRRFVRQTSCPGQFADLSLALEPSEDFVVACDPPPRTVLSPELFAGVLEGLRWPGRIEEGFAGIRATVVAARVHPVDSRPLSFSLAARAILDLAFEEAGCLRLGREFILGR